MILKHLVLALLVALLGSVASSAAGPTEPPPASAVSLSWLSEDTACAEKATIAPILGDEGVQTSAGLAATPFARRQDKSSFYTCCDDFCNTVCPCGGYPYSQCHNCRAICWCYTC
jgi:hypothetical protein